MVFPIENHCSIVLSLLLKHKTLSDISPYISKCIILILDTVCKVYYTLFAKLTLHIGGKLMKTKIAELRKERKISQEELALAVGVTRQTITSIEVEKYTASLPLAYKIARYFGLQIEDVFDFSDYED